MLCTPFFSYKLADLFIFSKMLKVFRLKKRLIYSLVCGCEGLFHYHPAGVLDYVQGGKLICKTKAEQVNKGDILHVLKKKTAAACNIVMSIKYVITK